MYSERSNERMNVWFIRHSTTKSSESDVFVLSSNWGSRVTFCLANTDRIGRIRTTPSPPPPPLVESAESGQCQMAPPLPYPGPPPPPPPPPPPFQKCWGRPCSWVFDARSRKYNERSVVQGLLVLSPPSVALIIIVLTLNTCIKTSRLCDNKCYQYYMPGWGSDYTELHVQSQLIFNCICIRFTSSHAYNSIDIYIHVHVKRVLC